GAIMAIGVAVANAILLVTFAERHRREKSDIRNPKSETNSNPQIPKPEPEANAIVSGFCHSDLRIVLDFGFRISDLAAVEGARRRLRPILMTSGAMLAGMIPMALALGEGGEQTAPLGRAVIGGLVAATLTTLLVLPAVFAAVQGRTGTQSVSLDPADPDSP